MESLCYEIIELLRLKNLTLASAESCTGGLISKMITDVAGCSDVFEGGVVSYSNDVKMKLLGVKAETLEKLADAIYKGQKAKAVKLSQAAIEEGIPADRIISDALMVGMNRLGCDFTLGKVLASNRSGSYSELDLGIAKLHFEIGSGKDSSIWSVE